MIDEGTLRRIVNERVAMTKLCEALGFDSRRVKRMVFDFNVESTPTLVVEHLVYERDLQEIVASLNHFSLQARPEDDVEHREKVGPLQ